VSLPLLRRTLHQHHSVVSGCFRVGGHLARALVRLCVANMVFALKLVNEATLNTCVAITITITCRCSNETCDENWLTCRNRGRRGTCS
jgi:hypothetical protein